jgi:thiamine kinase-like enzyme
VLAEDMPASGARLVNGHGDLHRGNWRLTERGPVIIDWEEVRRWPLSSELADFIVFGGLEPNDAAARFGLQGSDAESVAAAARACALSFYLYWLRALIDGTDPREGEFQDIAVTCERLFGD